ncbi:MAG: polysaccharide deacetylase family protein [Flavobacteriales bacterium]|nr:polysaccharide deacetylase family protein [Flavobacteriales bacterium]
MQPITIWIETASPRAQYAARQFFERLLGWPVRWATGTDQPRADDGPLLAYAEHAPEGAFHLKPCGWLSHVATDRIDPDVIRTDESISLFPVDGGAWPFDPLAAAFFMLTRYEEWVGLPTDAHDRPLTSAMHAARHGYLHAPVVDEWAMRIARAWRAFDSRVPLPNRRYSQTVTIDLDNGFKYLGRESWRSAGSFTRDTLSGRWRDAAERLKVLSEKAVDPFILDEALLTCFSEAAQRSIAFILAAQRGPWDHAVPVSDARYARYLRELAQRMEVGLHPSYYSSTAPDMMRVERDRLFDAIAQPITLSRQHFLRTRIPSTFREAVALGMREEHSMGCHDQIGFRAGTCTPYAWYDLEQEAETSLMIHPFAVMDNTLREKMKLSPDEAVARATEVIAAIKKVDGQFIGLWHESYLASSG